METHMMTRFEAVRAIVGILRVVVPLAAAAQAGRCRCGRSMPWHRMGWASPTCENHPGMHRDSVDDTHIMHLETHAEAIAGLRQTHAWADLQANRGWSTRMSSTLLPPPSQPYSCNVPMCGDSGVCDACRQRGAR